MFIDNPWFWFYNSKIKNFAKKLDLIKVTFFKFDFATKINNLLLIVLWQCIRQLTRKYISFLKKRLINKLLKQLVKKMKL